MSISVFAAAVLVPTGPYEQFVEPKRTVLRPAFNGQLTGEGLSIGRFMTNDLVIQKRTVSGHHASIVVRETGAGVGYVLRDHGSTNGTYINGERLRGEQTLYGGEMIGFAGTDLAVLRFIVEPLDVGATETSDLYEAHEERGNRLQYRGEEFYLDGIRLALTPNERRLMQLLYRQAGLCCDRASCARAVWGQSDPELERHPLDQLIAQLRRAKLQQLPADPEESKFIRTIHGRGFLLVLSPEQA